MRTAGNLGGTYFAVSCVLGLVVSFCGYAATPDKVVDSRLADAAMRGDKAAIRSLINQHVDVNSTQPDGSTALSWAARADDIETAALLISHGAAITANHYGVTPLSLAAANASLQMVEALLKAGADANTASPEGETALMIASRSGNEGAVKALLGHDAKVNAKEDWQGETALMFAAAENHLGVVRLLLEHGADPNTQSTVLEPPRQTAAAGQALQVTHATYPRGGLTALLFAARQGAMESARILAENKADLNLADPDGITPMIMAIINAHFDLAAMLLEKGANPNAVDKAGRGPLYAACDMHRFEWMYSRPAPKAVSAIDSTDLIVLLLDKVANPNERLTRRIPSFQHDSNGNSNLTAGSTPFMKAASVSDVSLMRLLIDRGADPNLATQLGTTPLMVAAGLNWKDVSGIGAEAESIEAIQICLDHGANVNAANAQGQTALHGAAERGADSVVAFLASKNAKLDAKTKAGRTPLDEAIGAALTEDEMDSRRPERVTTEALLRKLLGDNPAAAKVLQAQTDAGWSGWETKVYAEGSKDPDSRLQFRWMKQIVANNPMCVLEVGPAGDLAKSYVFAKILVSYGDGDGHPASLSYTWNDVSVSKEAHPRVRIGTSDNGTGCGDVRSLELHESK